MINQPLTILFITQEDPFYVRVLFEEFFAFCPESIHVAGVVICPTMGKKSSAKLLRQLYDFYGPFDFLRMLIRYLAVKASWDDLGRVCRHYDISVFRRSDINSPEFIAFCKKLGIEIIVSVAAPLIFKKELLEAPRWGCINIHHAPLPRYKGMMPNFWQMYHSEKEAGITVHSMNERIDEGDILLQKFLPIEPAESLDSLIRRSKRAGARYLLETLEAIRGGTTSPRPNPREGGTYFSFPTREDVREFRRSGKRLL